MGAGRCQPLAKGKGVRRGVESEGSRRQNSALGSTEIIRRKRGVSPPNRAKSNKRRGRGAADDAGAWNESGSPCRRRPRGRMGQACGNAVEARFAAGSRRKPWRLAVKQRGGAELQEVKANESRRWGAKRGQPSIAPEPAAKG
ncbi:MAG: hypothetical protein LBU32_20245 [Clostridiales bacterium]|nr:hypothetical protein [Clostridiales bacterium]